ncbi:MAG TPA: DUF1501 domain-containing protein, partial [Puia sp.]|nr:DUF1501 domain-containing protein [Puia sp.]
MTRKELHNQRLLREAEKAVSRMYTRRHFLQDCAMGFGALALGSLLPSCGSGVSTAAGPAFDPAHPLAPRMPMFPARAKRVIYLHMAGAPSQLELFDYKPSLAQLDGQDCPKSLLEGKRFAFIRGVPKMLGPQAHFQQRGQSGAWVSEHMPHLASIAD